MSIAQLSPSSVIANPAHINPQVKAEQATTVPQASQDAQRSVQAAQTETVTFSKQAVKKAVNDVFTSVQDIKDKAAQSALKASKEK